jgi:hypothetical protein
MPYNGSNVIAVPGSLYVAPLNTTQPTACTGTWPSGWISLGYTEQGSSWSIKPTVGQIIPEEQYTTLRNVVTAIDYSVTFNLFETTAQNWQLALNNGLTAGSQSGMTDGSYHLNPAVIGSEIRVMIGWDSLSLGTTSGTVGGRMVFRQAFQTGTMAISRRKGTNVATLAVTFSAEQPVATTPAVDIYVPAAMAS